MTTALSVGGNSLVSSVAARVEGKSPSSQQGANSSTQQQDVVSTAKRAVATTYAPNAAGTAVAASQASQITDPASLPSWVPALGPSEYLVAAPLWGGYMIKDRDDPFVSRFVGPPASKAPP
jgi:hypothetical protein